jgi:hypothetical protein
LVLIIAGSDWDEAIEVSGAAPAMDCFAAKGRLAMTRLGNDEVWE